ncbi:MAG: hypothetical protein WCT39_05230 [Candidatus Margulisiibacteriota bacterium]
MRLANLTLDTSVLPHEIFAGSPYQTTSLGLEIPKKTKDELREFLERYLKEAGIENDDGVFFRVDLYPDPEKEDVFWIIEVNALFVDGWGIGLNLARATGSPVEINGLGDRFPETWTTEDRAYLPELQLACDELRIATGRQFSFEPSFNCRISQAPAYWYGRQRPHEKLRPWHGETLDDKIVLVRLASTWRGERIRIPQSFSVETTPWDQLPDRSGLVFKLRRKWENPRMSVRFGDEIGKGKDVRRGYTDGGVIAQTRIPQATTNDGQPVQAIIMTAGTTPVSGYVQIARPGVKIINDNSLHGPLILV